MRSLLFLLSLAALSACTTDQADEQPPVGALIEPPTDIAVTHVRAITIGDTPSSSTSGGAISATGTVVSDQLARPSSKTGGLLSAVLVREGDDVRRGQTLARLDATELTAAVAQAEAGLDKARRDLTRVEALFADSVATRTQRDDARTGVTLAERQLEAIQFNRERNVITAPISGRILQKLANAGETIGPGMPIAIIQGTAAGDWRVRVGLTDAQWAATSVGQRATVSFDAFPGKRFAARLTERASAADPANGTFPIEVKLSEQPPSLAAGLVAKVELQREAAPAGAKANTIEVPLTALGRINGKRAEVFVIRAQAARARDVQLGATRGGTIEVLSGLELGDQLITTGVAWLRDGDPVQLAAGTSTDETQR